MAEPRAVRIVRRPSPPSPNRTEPGPEVSDDETPLAFRENRAGTARATRLFAVFGVGLAVIYLLFLGLAATSPSPGVQGNPVVYALLTALTVALALFGWFITLGRAPLSYRLATDAVVVRERTGRLRRFSANDRLRVRVAAQYSSGFLGADATELVEISTERARKRSYLVAAGAIEERGPSGLR